jgi:hypothetical protein
VEKGKRKGQEVSWKDLIGGSVGLTQGLRESIQVGDGDSDS